MFAESIIFSLWSGHSLMRRFHSFASWLAAWSHTKSGLEKAEWLPWSHRLFLFCFLFFALKAKVVDMSMYFVHCRVQIDWYHTHHKWLVIPSQNTQAQVWRESCVFLNGPATHRCAVKAWRWVCAAHGSGCLWCNFRSCSWQLLVESKLKTSWFRYHSGEDQRSTVKLGLSCGNVRLSQLTQMCFIWHSLSLIPCLNCFIWKKLPFWGEWIAGPDRGTGFWLLG